MHSDRTHWFLIIVDAPAKAAFGARGQDVDMEQGSDEEREGKEDALSDEGEEEIEPDNLT